MNIKCQRHVKKGQAEIKPSLDIEILDLAK